MPSTYTTSGIELIADGEKTNTWGSATNNNLKLLDQLVSQAVSISLAGSTHTVTISDGFNASSEGQYGVLLFGGAPSGTNTVTISPNDAKRVFIVKNDSGESVVLTQGSGGSVTVADGRGAIVYCDGAGSGAEVVDLTAVMISTLSTLGITASAAELNTLDGVTATTAELNILDGVTATTAELNILDGVTASAAELNILDGVTASTAELNILDGVTATASELNTLDGVTATASELNILDGVTATTAELNILDGVTATASELNILDGVTATTAELNYVDGVTSNIQTQLDTMIGVGQTWQSFSSPTREVDGTSYQNTTGEPIIVSVGVQSTNTGYLQVSDDDATWITVGTLGGFGNVGDTKSASAVIPDDWYYRASGTSLSAVFWAELR